MVQAMESLASRQESVPVDTEREAWTLILNGAESHVEDAIDEDGSFTPDEYEKITSRALELIKQLREEKDIAW